MRRARSPRLFRHAQRPGDDVVLERLVRHRILERGDPAAYRDARGVHALGRAGDQRMPPIKVAALRQQTICTSWRQPGDLADIVRREAYAIGDFGAAVLVIAAAAGLGVEETAADIGVIDAAGVLVLQLVEAAAPAPVA